MADAHQWQIQAPHVFGRSLLSPNCQNLLTANHRSRFKTAHLGTKDMVDIKLLVVQICVILMACYSVGWLLRKFHQPQVVGEMVAGILLGPSLLGWVAPG